MMNQPLSRRHFLQAAGLVGLGVTVAACTPAVAPASPGSGAAAPAAAADHLQILWVSQTALVEYFQKYADETFGPAHNGATVEIEVAPNQEFPQKILAGIAAGAPPDIFRSVNVENFAQFALSDVTLALDDLIARDNYGEYLDTFLPGSLETFQLRGKQYGIPFGAHPSSQYLFYNKTHLTEQGITLDNPDWTWEEYADVVRKVADPDNQVFGAWIRANFEGYMCGVRSMGGDLIDEEGTKSLINTEEAWRFWNLMYALIAEEGVAAQPTEVTDWKPPFAEGKIMLANDNGYRESFLREMVTTFEFDTFLIPNEGDKPRGGLIADTPAIAAASGQVDLAWAWVKGLLETEQGVRRVQEARYIPLPTEAALLDPAALVSPQYEFYVRQWIANPPLPAPSAANGRSSEVFAALQSGLEAAWLKTEALATVIEQVDREVQTILDKDPA
ncbi:MAG: substrate-binding domain-containing protein [Caldilineaceae bacterium]